LRANTLTARLLDSLPLIAHAPQAAHNRGWNLFYSQAVRSLYVERREACLEVNERGQASFVTVTLNDGSISVRCDCQKQNASGPEICRHKVAAVLRLQAELRAHPIETWETALAGVLKEPRRQTRPQPRHVLVFGLLEDYSGWHLAAFRIPARQFPVEILTDNAALSAWLAGNRAVAREAKIVRTAADLSSFTNAGEDVAQFAHMLGLASQGYYSHDASADFAFGVVLPRIAGFPLFRGKNSGYDRSLASPLTMIPGSITPAARLDETEDGLRLHLDVPLPGAPIAAEVQIVCEDPLWFISGDRLVSVKDSGTAFLPLLKAPDVTIPREDEDDFLAEYLAPLAERVALTGSAITWEGGDATLEKRLYLSEADDGIAARLLFAYGEQEVTYEKAPPEESIRVRPGTRTLVRLRRDADEEQKAYESLNGFGLKRGREPGVFVLRAKTHPVDFLLHQVPRLAASGFTVFGEEELASARVNRNTPTLSFNVSSGIDWFDVAAVAHFGNLEVSLKDIRRAVRKKERYIKLADGTIGALPAEWLEKYSRLFAFSEETDEGMRLGSAQVTLLDQVLEDAEAYEADEEFGRRRDRLRDFTSIVPRDLPRGLDAELRPYQKAGFDWLHFLHDYGFGGCLADDMGLGKTLETLAFLLSLREAGHADAPDLIVMPRSLLFNWQREAARFAPSLRIHIHADKDRATDLDELDPYDLVLTTYGVMLRDIETLRHKRFHYAVLDESQAIKNPLSKTARAARLLKPDHRLALTGTPVENSTAELWSQFAFLNPGLLGGLDNFRTEFTAPIERHQNAEAADFLRKMVYPFVLRRTKAQVAPELPERSERILLTDMEPAQRKLYDKYRDYFRAQVLGLLDTGSNNARMKVLEGLLRLRQISNDPRTVDSHYKGGSGKFEALMDTLETLTEEGHKALVFSQFTQMLALVKAELDAKGIPYVYLDGKTKDRQTPVDTFQSDESIPLFLVSLKAGGVGLNLTAADYVVHIDPWWNPAVEMQATDRTHRIGQDKPVFIYKLIARDSVEEKILQLQDRKRSLVNALITTDAGFFKSLTRDDVEMLFE
jgi:non-specific serine/threonine protein kinase